MQNKQKTKIQQCVWFFTLYIISLVGFIGIFYLGKILISLLK